jgi:hypothetical protein
VGDRSFNCRVHFLAGLAIGPTEGGSITPSLMGAFVCLDEGQMQARGQQVCMFVCLDTFWARPARCLKQSGARPRRNEGGGHFSGAWLCRALTRGSRYLPIRDPLVTPPIRALLDLALRRWAKVREDAQPAATGSSQACHFLPAEATANTSPISLRWRCATSFQRKQHRSAMPTPLHCPLHFTQI